MAQDLFNHEPDAAIIRELEQKVLEAVAMHSVPVGLGVLGNTLRAMRVCTLDNQLISDPVIKNVVNELVHEGKLLGRSRGSFQEFVCPREQLEPLLDQAMAAGRLIALAKAVSLCTPGPRGFSDGPSYQTYDELIRDLRIALIQKDFILMGRLARAAFGDYFASVRQHPLLDVDSRGHRAWWMERISPRLPQRVLLSLARSAVLNITPSAELQQALAEIQWVGELGDAARSRRAELALLCGDADLALAALGDGQPGDEQTGDGQTGDEQTWVRQPGDGQTYSALTLKAWAALVRGDVDGAKAGYALALAALCQTTRKRNRYFHDLAGLFSVLPLLAAHDWETVADLVGRAKKDEQNPFGSVYTVWRPLLAVRQGQSSGSISAIRSILSFPGPVKLLPLLALYWIDPQQLTPHVDIAKQLLQQAKRAGMHWLAAQVQALLNRHQGYAPDPSTEGRAPLVDLLVHVEPWEAALDALTALGSAPAGAAADDAQPPVREERVAWWLMLDQGRLTIHPKLQKRTQRDRWSEGRNIALEVLHAGNLSALDDDDRRVCAAINVERRVNGRYRGRGMPQYMFDPNRLWLALVGHPRVFNMFDTTTTLELVLARPTLRVQRQKGRLLLALEPPLPEDGIVVKVVEETRNRWRVVRFDDSHKQIGELLGNGLSIPLEAEERVRAAITRIAPHIDVHSDIGGDEVLPRIDGDPTPYMALIPNGDGLTAELRVRPLGGGGSSFTPGHGGAELTALAANGVRSRVSRNLGEEQNRARVLLESCSALNGREVETFVWSLPEPQDSLELLEQLLELNEQVVVEWPRGQNLFLSARASGAGFSLSLSKRSDWFDATGELKVNENLVFDLQRLLTLLDTGGGSRFLPLGDGRFLALTESFRRRLQDLRDMADSGSRKPRYHPLNAPILEEIARDFGHFETDAAWQESLDRLRRADTRPAAVPTTFVAELRDYQTEGYRWLMRMAAWGVGACLADDMGLGKTIQVLAVLVARAPLGPSMVVAPTSVCGNWLSEAQRFAPTLNPIVFGTGDRQVGVQALGPFDLLIVSYGLMQQETELLRSREDWNCLILDEAQAIKNPATQRARAAFELPAAFRVATTGTPVENHLGELWSLFRFLNPGLLGSREAFNQRYALPIERDQNHEVRDRLRRLVRPFMLRRLKSAVLEELPPRTEIQLQVDPSPRETAFYEALRRQILERLGTSGVTPNQQERFEVLAAITRLRRAACNPELVSPGIGIASGKLNLFLEVVDELRAGRHRALVFSQFVDHLNLVRAALDERGISYQYLDGSTPANARAERVAAFQSGTGDLFLISLKAGGTGLNLTAADYVIHLDPWWNPAVEDQASDRAHRIGQQRPVTVYRIIMRGSIEERIIDLHARKRDLADTLLEGGDASARLDTEALLALLREERG